MAREFKPMVFPQAPLTPLPRESSHEVLAALISKQTKSFVYVVNTPMFYDRNHTQWAPKINVKPALEYGRLRFLTKYEHLSPTPDAGLDQLAKNLEPFTAYDYLLLAGPPWLMCWASIIAAKKTNGWVKFLIWKNGINGHIGRYQCIDTNLYAAQPIIESISDER